ncbi:MAG TPA: pyridoxal-phosphate dependent enzyme [Acidimicrobiales bacterium]|nr:pyridoxal-phosphate dependent enzyme [Acidimicrobiales bacterium]
MTQTVESTGAALAARPRVPLATLPTPLEGGVRLPGGAPLLVKRDDLTGLGMGGNKARKLEFLCGAARAGGADTVVTVGAAQSNHARMTAAACARLGWQAHLVLGRSPAPGPPAGNQILSRLFGARLHVVDTEDWDDLEAAAEELAAELTAAGRRVEVLPMGGSTPVGALGFLAAWMELMDQCQRQGHRPSTVVTASSTGGTHGGLLAGQAMCRAAGMDVPDLVAVGVAKTAADLTAEAGRIAAECLEAAGLPAGALGGVEVHVDQRAEGPGYAVPTADADAAILWAARTGGWVLDRVYTGKALAGLLMMDGEGRFSADRPVVFWHTGGQPAVFAPGGVPESGGWDVK